LATTSRQKTKFLEFLKIHGERYFKWIQPVTEWFNKPNLFSVSYENLSGTIGVASQKSIYSKLNNFLELDNQNLLDGSYDMTAINTKTMTSTGKPSNWKNYWSDETESVLKKSGFYQLNQNLGYD
jgi:hypothetical protein